MTADTDTVERVARAIAKSDYPMMDWDELSAINHEEAYDAARAAIAALSPDSQPLPIAAGSDPAVELSDSSCRVAPPTPSDAPQCHGCGREYGEPGFPDLVVPHDIWAQISPTGDEGGLLCPSCICEALERKGTKTTAKFTSGPLVAPTQSDPVAEAAKTILDDRFGGYGNRAAMTAMWEFVYREHGRHMLPQSHYDGVFQAGLRALTNTPDKEGGA